MTSLAIRTVVIGVRSSWETSETNRRCSRLSSSSWRICFCRLEAIWLNEVARRARSSSPVTRMPLLELPGGEPLGDAARHPDRGDHLPGDQPGEAGDQEQQRHAGDEHRARHQREGLALLVEGVEVVERVGVAVGRQAHLAADHDARTLGQAGDVARWS